MFDVVAAWRRAGFLKPSEGFGQNLPHVLSHNVLYIPNVICSSMFDVNITEKMCCCFSLNWILKWILRPNVQKGNTDGSSPPS